MIGIHFFIITIVTLCIFINGCNSYIDSSIGDVIFSGKQTKFTPENFIPRPTHHYMHEMEPTREMPSPGWRQTRVITTKPMRKIKNSEKGSSRSSPRPQWNLILILIFITANILYTIV